MTDSVLTAIITGVCGPVLLVALNYYFEKRKKKGDILVDALETSIKVLNKLDLIKEDYSADRVWITQFHNGGHFYPTGKSIAKFSMIYEAVAPQVASTQQTLQNIPVGLFSRSLNELINNNFINLPDLLDPNNSSFGLRSIGESNGCKSVYAFAIKDIDGKLVGVLGLDYTKKKLKLTEEDIKDLEIQAAALSGVLGH